MIDSLSFTSVVIGDVAFPVGILLARLVLK